MMGIKSFTATSGLCSFDYYWTTYSSGGTYGAEIQKSIPYNATCAFSADISTILLMMEYTCPATTTFDPVTQMCNPSCGAYTYRNTTDNSCYPCQNTLCYSCNANNSNQCLSCAANFTFSNNTCICDTSSNNYMLVNGSCLPCSLQFQCTSCSYSGDATQPYTSSGLFCLICNQTNGYFIDPNNDCLTCSISNCVTCIGYSTCSVCNSGYGVTSTGACSTCPLSGCQTCANLTYCSVCQSGYTKNNGICETCLISCNCGGYQLPRYSNGDCSAKCGDGIKIFPYEGCDDGNTNNGDGCSSTCQIEASSACTGQPSKCYYTSKLSL